MQMHLKLSVNQSVTHLVSHQKANFYLADCHIISPCLIPGREGEGKWGGQNDLFYLFHLPPPLLSLATLPNKGNRGTLNFLSSKMKWNLVTIYICQLCRNAGISFFWPKFAVFYYFFNKIQNWQIIVSVSSPPFISHPSQDRNTADVWTAQYY